MVKPPLDDRPSFSDDMERLALEEAITKQRTADSGQSDRRFWQHLAALALLAGSAAFSYVAWSQASLPGVATQNDARPASVGEHAAEGTPSGPSTEADLKREQVLLLREENQLLVDHSLPCRLGGG